MLEYAAPYRWICKYDSSCADNKSDIQPRGCCFPLHNRLLFTFLQNQSKQESSRREAILLSRMKHPNIVAFRETFDGMQTLLQQIITGHIVLLWLYYCLHCRNRQCDCVVSADDLLCIVMEYCRGGDLLQRIRRQKTAHFSVPDVGIDDLLLYRTILSHRFTGAYCCLTIIKQNIIHVIERHLQLYDIQTCTYNNIRFNCFLLLQQTRQTLKS